jgi:hypothetical protein
LLFQFGIDIFRAAAMLTVLFSDLSIGQMLAVFSYLWFMIGPVEQLLNLQYAYYAAGGALTASTNCWRGPMSRSTRPPATRSPAARPWASRCATSLWLWRRAGAGPDEPVHRPR